MEINGNYSCSLEIAMEVEFSPSLPRTIGIVDGSGVLYDPSGVSRAELKRLAQRRSLAVF